jgi:hypothetical protein
MAANSYGRAVDVPMTNKSGGQVVLGDVVIYDSTTNDSFTTTTSAASLLAAGVAQETIASNGIGRIRTLGYTSLVNTSGSVTRLDFGATHTVAKQAADVGATRAVGTFMRFLSSGATPDAVIYPVDLAGAALTNPMTTAQDTIVGGSLGTPGRLAVGAAGAAYSVINGAVAWNSGTSFPGSKLTGDRYWRTDLGMEFYYDGTRWLSVQLNQMMLTNQDAFTPISATQSVQTWRAPSPVWAGSDIWMVSSQTWFYVNGGTALSGSHKWVGVVASTPGNTTIDTVNINSGASDTYRQSTATSVAALLGTSNFLVGVLWTKTGTPGTLYTQTTISYRYVAT